MKDSNRIEAHKEVEDMMNKMIGEEEVVLLKDFDSWLQKHRKKQVSLIMDYYTIAEYCLEKENQRPRRLDKLSIKSEVKK